MSPFQNYTSALDKLSKDAELLAEKSKDLKRQAEKEPLLRGDPQVAAALDLAGDLPGLLREVTSGLGTLGQTLTKAPPPRPAEDWGAFRAAAAAGDTAALDAAAEAIRRVLVGRGDLVSLVVLARESAAAYARIGDRARESVARAEEAIALAGLGRLDPARRAASAALEVAEPERAARLRATLEPLVGPL